MLTHVSICRITDTERLHGDVNYQHSPMCVDQWNGLNWQEMDPANTRTYVFEEESYTRVSSLLHFLLIPLFAALTTHPPSR
jgi:hypothetical protein